MRHPQQREVVSRPVLGRAKLLLSRFPHVLRLGGSVAVPVLNLPLTTLAASRTVIAVVLAVCAVLPSSLPAELDAKPPAKKTQSPAKHQPVPNEQVTAIFKSKCFRCHGRKIRESGLNLSTSVGIAKGGDSGLVVVPGKPEDSPLYVMIRDGEMPPKDEGTLSKDQIQTIRKWILDGAGTGSSRGARLTHDDINPILLLRCTACHGAQKREAGLDLRSLATMLKGGKSGPALFPGKPNESLIVKKIASGQMPPRRRLVEASLKVIEPQEVALLRTWIAQGAKESNTDSTASTVQTATNEDDNKFWSFRSPRADAVPQVQHFKRVQNPIDAFVWRKLEERGLTLSPDAEPLTLMRRAYFDLTGLPPTPAEVDTFKQESRRHLDAAYVALVDRLLASSRYGERWARSWLDVAGYSDSEGITHQDSVRVNSWRYRDYVIRAFNADKPYDRFLLEQIAGDELADYRNADIITPEIYDNLVATGFLRMAPDGTWANITNFVPDRLDVIGDEIEILSSATMGLTFKCARCHSHKFDPISHRDYFSLLAIFKGAYDEHNWLKPYKATQFSSGPFGTRQLSFVTTVERNAWEANEQRIEKEVARIKADLESKKKSLNEAEFKKASEESDRKIKELGSQRKPQPMIRALWDRGEPSKTYLLRRGNYLTPGRAVEPNVPSFLAERESPLEVKPPRPNADSTGRRLAFARWLVQDEHPLTSRVMVNRIWKHHFGHGIVRTLDNFGKTGARPTHPKLLDWLAVEFVKQGWSVKSMHRLMMTSSTYRQASNVEPIHEQADPENQLLSRMPLRRLEAESLRDTLLFVSGRLDSRPFGPPDQVKMQSDGLVTSVGSSAGWRRSIYVLRRRTQVPTILDNFDLPQMGPNCIERTQSTVAPQALHLMNNEMIHRLSIDFADRIIAEFDRDVERQIERVYLTALSRGPRPEERQLARGSLERLNKVWQTKLNGDSKQGNPDEIQEQATRHALANLCHVIMNSASLLYVD